MKLTANEELFLVFDEVLPETALVELRRKATQVEYVRHGTTVVNPPWRLEDGGQLYGPRFWLSGEGPTVDELSLEFASALEELAANARVVDLVGAQGADWARVAVTPWIYPRGTALSMHTDGDTVTGAFAFYYHEQWAIRWGGLLVVMRTGQDCFDLATSEDLARQQGSADYSLGDAIVPIPNRLVVVPAGAKHLMTRIDDSAGDRFRLSLSGGFHIQTD
jgi:hypothetical protein